MKVKRTGMMASVRYMRFGGRVNTSKKIVDENFGRNRTDETTETLAPLLLGIDIDRKLARAMHRDRF
jgi:hypothetical protein